MPGSITGRSSSTPKTRRPGTSVRVNSTAHATPIATEPTVFSAPKTTLLRTAVHHAGSERRSR